MEGDIRFEDAEGEMKPAVMNLATSAEEVTSCCLSKSLSVKSYGRDCPSSTAEVAKISRQCKFTPSIQRLCNNIYTHQQKISQYCRYETKSCVLQNNHYRPCPHSQFLQ